MKRQISERRKETGEWKQKQTQPFDKNIKVDLQCVHLNQY